jgi:MFS family permease
MEPFLSEAKEDRAQRPLGAFLLSALFAEVSAQAVRLALLARADRVGGSTSAVATVLFAEAFIALLIGILGGPLLDRYDPRWGAILSNLWRGACTISLLWVESFSSLVLFAGLFALGDGLYVPARSSMVARLAGVDGVLALNSKVGAAQGLALVLGPIAWTVANHFGGPSIVPVILGVSFFLSGFLLVGVRTDYGVASLGYFEELKTGLSFVAKSPVIRMGLFLFGLAVLLVGGFYPLLPSIATQNSPGNTENGMGAMVVGLGIGGVSGAVLAPRLVSRFGRGRVAIFTVILDGAFFAGLSVVWGLFGVSLWMLGWGVVILVSLIAFTTLFQEESPLELRGRVLALLPPLQGAGTALAFALVAIFASGFSLRQITLLGGLGLITVTLVLWALPVGRGFAKSGKES